MNTMNRVKELAAERNLTLYELAQRCELSYPSLRQTEKRNGQLRVDTIERICKELGVTLSFFFAEGGIHGT